MYLLKRLGETKQSRYEEWFCYSCQGCLFLPRTNNKTDTTCQLNLFPNIFILQTYSLRSSNLKMFSLGKKITMPWQCPFPCSWLVWIGGVELSTGVSKWKMQVLALSYCNKCKWQQLLSALYQWPSSGKAYAKKYHLAWKFGWVAMDSFSHFLTSLCILAV